MNNAEAIKRAHAVHGTPGPIIELKDGTRVRDGTVLARAAEAPKVKDEAAHRRFLRRKYKATHAIVLYGPTSKDHSKYGAGGEFTGAESGLRCFCFLKQGTKWTHIVDTATQTLRKVENSVWKELARKAWLLDKKGRKINDIT